ncbi:Sodium- and chloride-dependent GABA transporter 1 [Elasticomyces elasticus]|nr:Sodium- and chloride-dependent GABA transporter 1 [Elasticomyces elasticus]
MVKLNFPPPETAPQTEILHDAVFPTWKDDTSTETFDSPEDMQRKDPLGTQICKLYNRTKTRLPNQERMENLTWRMMAMNLKRLEREQAHHKTVPGPPTSAPSGIAQQLRMRAESPGGISPDDSMNIDDFIVPSSFASPEALSTTMPTGMDFGQEDISSNGLSTARGSRQPKQANVLPSASMPRHAQQNRRSEFDYVQRRVRKTSIDEKAVGSISHLDVVISLLIASRIGSAEQNFRLKCHLSTGPQTMQGFRTIHSIKHQANTSRIYTNPSHISRSISIRTTYMMIPF